jgi:phosphate starvation-inducible PhoH-like protein
MAGKSKKVKGTKQTIEYKEEPKKLHVKPLKCMNQRQKDFVQSIEKNEITICTGLAGSGKTYVALSVALKMLEKSQIKQIVLVKSVQPLPEEELGILPGDMYEKIEPFMMSFFGNIDKIIGPEERKRLVREEKIVIQPLAYVRGINIDESCVILDETQNLSVNVFKSIITRIGKDSKYIIMGDTEQIDMKRREKSALSKIVKLFENDDAVGVVEFHPDDCVRNPIIPHLLEKIKEIE